MSQFDNLNLNQFLQPNDSIPGQMAANPTQVPWKFGFNQPIQGKQLKLSQVNLKSSIINSSFTSGTFGLNNSTTVNLTTTITNNAPHGNDPTFSLPHMAFYKGTTSIGTNQIYPALGNGITTNTFVCWGGYNYNSFDGTNTTWTASISNISGGSVTIYYAIQHKYLKTNSGTQS